MGGDDYADDRDVVQAAAGVQYSAQATAVFKKTECSPRALPPNRMKDNTDPGLHTAAATPIVVAMDVTASRGNDAKILYDKLPMFIGSMNMNAYADNPEVSFAAIGDAPCEDRFPIQVTDFLDGKGRGDKSMDGWISSLFLEEGGGGTGEESYELTALYYARMAKLAPGVRGLFFIMGDESFYSVLKRADVDRFIGPGLVDGDVPVAHIFHELQSKFDVFMLYPRKPLEVRRKAIDEELARRLEREGAKCGDVTISLMWSTRDDLDLWVTCPSGQRIMYSSKRSSCGGELDVDMNAGGRLSDKPVENVFWKGAPTGKYKVEVDLYCMRQKQLSPRQQGKGKQHELTVPFRLAITILGETEMLDGVCSESKRRVVAKEFVYDGKPPATAAEEEAKYAAYSDEHILASW
mmetsp:Transcript_16622/g.48891  ORF Transcript_16622/g.48891 Transcript_16622/m.48891 type:complete len:407 (+) Transcript_16622:98-1318(+)